MPQFVRWWNVTCVRDLEKSNYYWNDKFRKAEKRLIMRRLFSLFVVALLVFVAGCSNDMDMVQFSLDKSEVEIPAGGGTVEVRVVSNMAWELTGYTSWCKPSVKSGKGSATGEVVTFTAERADKERKVTYRFKAGGETFELVVRQAMVPQLRTSDTDIHWVMPEGGEVELRYEANIECEVVVPDEAQEWLSADTRALGLRSARLVTQPNTTNISREAEVVVRSIENPIMSVKFTVRQPSDKNIIRYTTSDGKIFEPSSGAFNAAITNNLYLDGVGIIEFQNRLTTIRDKAFMLSYFNNLKSIVLPDGVESIGEAAFYQCFLLEDVALSGSLLSIGESAFAECESLTDVVIPDGVQTIGDGAFLECNELRSVTMSDSVTSLGALCFDGCESLERVRLSDNITTIQSSTFYGCVALRELNIPSKLEDVGCYAFCGCIALPDIKLSDGLKSIGDYTFMSCHEFTEIDIPEGVTLMGDNCLGDCPKLVRVSLPESLEVLGANAFVSCLLLREVNIPESITKLGDGLFQGCESLESVVLPPMLEVVGDFAFAGCTSLTEIDIPATVTHINQLAFAYCHSLERATVHSVHLKQIQGSAFAYCPSLTHLELYSIEPPQLPELSIFDGCSEKLGVYVPTKSVETYKGDTAWSTYANYILPLE